MSGELPCLDLLEATPAILRGACGSSVSGTGLMISRTALIGTA